MTPFGFTRKFRFCPCGLVMGVVLISNAAAACSNPNSPTPTRSVEIVFQGRVDLRPDLPEAALECARSLPVTLVHPSWRGYDGVPMSATLSFDAWQITFHDVPIDETVRFRINDKNWCDRSPTGTVLRDVSANGVPLAQNTTTSGPAGDEPGFAFTVDELRQVRQ